MKVPDKMRLSVKPLASNSFLVSATTPPSSSSLTLPRLFTSRTTLSLPLKGTKDLSGSDTLVNKSNNWGISLESSGTGDNRVWPLSLCMPNPISISEGDRSAVPEVVPGTWRKAGQDLKFRQRESRTWVCPTLTPIVAIRLAIQVAME